MLLLKRQFCFSNSRRLLTQSRVVVGSCFVHQVLILLVILSNLGLISSFCSRVRLGAPAGGNAIVSVRWQVVLTYSDPDNPDTTFSLEPGIRRGPLTRRATEGSARHGRRVGADFLARLRFTGSARRLKLPGLIHFFADRVCAHPASLNRSSFGSKRARKISASIGSSKQ